MSDIHLRPYQVKFIDDIRQQFKAGHKNVVGVAPCGSGKTIITGWLAREVANNNKRVLFMVHRQELIEQTSKTFFELNLDHGIICSGVQPNYNLPVQIASVQTLVRRIDKVPKPDLLICDECHHVLANNYKKIIDEWKPLLLGVTATPERLGGVTLNDVFSSMVIGPSVGALIDQGNLAPFNYFTTTSAVDTSKIRSSFGEFRSNDLSALMDRQAVIGDLIDSYRQHADNKQTIVYCVNVKHSKHTAELFNQAGITAAHVDGESEKTLRRRIIEDFRDGKIKVLCNAELFGEGFDVPNCDCVILARPTQSLTLFIQQSMRCMRPNPANKDKVAIIIDHVENVKRFGLPDQDRHWSLFPNAEKESKPAPLKECPHCHALVYLSCRFCNSVDKPLKEIDKISMATFAPLLTSSELTIKPDLSKSFFNENYAEEFSKKLDPCFDKFRGKNGILRHPLALFTKGGEKVAELFDKYGNLICGHEFPFNDYVEKGGEIVKHTDSKEKGYSSERAENKIVTAPTTIEELLIAARITNHKPYWAAMKAIAYAKTLEECLHIAEVCGYKPGWAHIQWNEKNDTNKFISQWANRNN